MIVWTRDNLSRLGERFLNRVLINFQNDGQASVYFGNTGRGIIPNYEIKHSNDSVVTYRGQNHNPHTLNQFEEGNLSEPFRIDDIRDAINSI